MTESSPPAVAHPEHDAVAREIRGWFTASAPEIGYEVSEHWYGYLSNLSDTVTRLILDIDKPGQVASALAEARAACAPRQLTIWVDDRERAGRLAAALRRSCGRPGGATTHLALAGRMTAEPGPAHLVMETIGEDRLEEWATVKLQAFGDTETAPRPDHLAAEISTRRAELALTDHQLGLLDGEPVAVLAYYRGADQLVFNLGTRVPYRRRNIAQAMLARWVDAGRASGCRSLIINAEDGGRPAELYRRLGFVDEIYWYQKYDLTAGVEARSQ